MNRHITIEFPCSVTYIPIGITPIELRVKTYNESTRMYLNQPGRELLGLVILAASNKSGIMKEISLAVTKGGDHDCLAGLNCEQRLKVEEATRLYAFIKNCLNRGIGGVFKCDHLSP